MTEAAINDQTGAVEIPTLDVVVEKKEDPKPAAFPFEKSDIKYWVIKRKDGVIAKYILTEPVKTLPATTTGWNPPATSYYTSFRDFCTHEPNPGKDLPIVDEAGKRIFIADCQGLRKVKYMYDFVLDNGDVLTPGVNFKPTLVGEDFLISQLRQYVTVKDPALLKVDWPDRQDPPLHFEFWPAFTDMVTGDIVTACQGGHGRSGTSLVCMMMCLIPDYTPYAAICHLRALHCARAIESKVQHEYIGKFGEFLGRGDDVSKVEEVKDFKEAFLALDLAGAKKYQEQLKGGKK